MYFNGRPIERWVFTNRRGYNDGYGSVKLRPRGTTDYYLSIGHRGQAGASRVLRVHVDN